MPVPATDREQAAVIVLMVDRELTLLEAHGGPPTMQRLFIGADGRLQGPPAAWAREVFATTTPAVGRALANPHDPSQRLVCTVLPLVQEQGAVVRAQIVLQPMPAALDCDVRSALRAQAQLAAIVESAQDGIVSKSLDGIVQSWNRSAERMFGYTAQEMIGRSITAIIPPERYAEEDYILSRVRQGLPVERYETVRMHKDGRRLPVSLLVSPVRNAEGRVIGASKIVQDISARQKAQQALRRRERELRMVTDAVPACIAYVDLELRYRFVSRAYEDWFGLSRKEIEGRTVAEILGEAAFRVVRPYLERALKGEAVRFETWAEYGNGALRYIDADYLPRRDEEGNVEGLFVLVTDLTARKLVEERLAHSEARYRILVNNLSDAIVLADTQRRIVLVNPAFSAIFGYTPEEALGRPTEMLYGSPEDYRRLGDQRYHLAADTSVSAYAIRYRRKDGSIFWAETRGSAVRDETGTLIGFLGIHRDITDRKRAEDALRDSEERFRLMTETIPGIVFTSRPDGACDYVNQRWCQLTGTPAQAALGCGWLELVHPDDQGPALEHWRSSVVNEELFECKYRMRGADGRYRWAIVRAQPLRGTDGRIRKWLGVCADIHELVQAQEALQESHRRKDEFLAMLAHELRNPLAPVMTAVEVLQLQAGDLEGRIGWATQIIQRQTRHLARLVDDLLDIARIVSGRIQLRRSTVDITKLAERAAESARARVRDKRLTLSVTLPREPLYAYADAGRITQVLDNLLDNAVKYTEAGGEVWFTMMQEERQIVVRVRDTGIGIAAEDLPRIFELFEQASPGLDRAQGGLGLGLNLVQRLVQKHAGSVEACSGGPGQGSEFVIRLPLVEPDSIVTDPEGSAESGQPASPRSVLIVEDNPDIAEALQALLEAMGHHTRTAADGAGCLELVAQSTPDLVLLDLGLPGMNGYDVARILRRRFPKGSLRLVALTGYGRDEDRRRSLEVGFDQHLIKPVDQATLVALLRAGGDAQAAGLDTAG